MLLRTMQTENDSTASFQGWPGAGGGQAQSRAGQEPGASPCTGRAPSLRALPPTSSFPVQGGECSCFTIKLFFPFHTNTSSLLGLCLMEVWSSQRRGSRPKTACPAFCSTSRKVLVGRGESNQLNSNFPDAKRTFPTAQDKICFQYKTAIFLHVCPIAAQLKTGLSD